MSLVAPVYLVAALVGAVIAAALHLFVRRRPPSRALPTARFIPDTTSPSRALARRPADGLLLALRAGALVLAGLALATPRAKLARHGTARVVAVDVSAAADPSAVVAAAHPLLDGASAVIVFDTAAREVRVGAPDTLAAIARYRAAIPAGSLSAALVAAMHVGPRLAAQADSIALVLVTPALVAERDRATSAIRALWPGRIEVVRPPPTARAPGAVHVEWADSSPSPAWTRRPQSGVPGAVWYADAALVAPLVRRWKAAQQGRVVARWVDGEPAVLERATPDGCVRSLGVTVPSQSDLSLRPEFERFVMVIASGACGGVETAPLDRNAMDSLRGPARLARASDLSASTATVSPFTPMLLAVALALLLVETLLRRRP